MFDIRKEQRYIEQFYILLPSPEMNGMDCRDMVGKEVSIQLSEETQDGVLLSQYYLFEKIAMEDHFILVVNPVDHGTIRKNVDNHFVKSGPVKVVDVMDLFECGTWDKLWEFGIDMCVYSRNILYYLASNGLFVQLSWYLTKIKPLTNSPFNKEVFAKTILQAAILHNHLDIIQFVTVELESDLRRYGMDADLIMVISKVAAREDVEPDYCYYMIELLINKGFFRDLCKQTIIIQMHILLFESAGHKKTSALLKRICDVN